MRGECCAALRSVSIRSSSAVSDYSLKCLHTRPNKFRKFLCRKSHAQIRLSFGEEKD